ncbi:DarT ssDNA thymidine ADP-ribosyltransferase family protein, partial [Variovorax sp. 2RAF20]
MIWRIVHRDNIPWILTNGLHCVNSKIRDPNYVNIGNVDLIDKRRHRIVPVEPGGTLTDYIPFYFTPFSV